MTGVLSELCEPGTLVMIVLVLVELCDYGGVSVWCFVAVYMYCTHWVAQVTFASVSYTHLTLPTNREV